MFCCVLLCVHSSIAIILMGKRELVALLDFSSWCLMMVERLFLAVPRGFLIILTNYFYMLNIKNSLVMIELLHYFIMQFYSRYQATTIKHNLCGLPESILFRMVNMKSISIVFPHHTHYGNILIFNVFFQLVNEGKAITSRISWVMPIHLHGLGI